MTASQLKAKKIPVPSIDSAIFLHDQITTVTLRPYWLVSFKAVATTPRRYKYRKRF